MALFEIVFDCVLEFILMFSDKYFHKMKVRYVIFGWILFVCLLIVGLFLYDYLT